jgi:hypothetical protein
MDVPLETRFKILCEITRAQHFAWREAALTLAPNLDGKQLTEKMWEITGLETAKAYLPRIDRQKPLPIQIAQCIAFSSICMGESVSVEERENGEAFIRHHDCPWFRWHQRFDLLHEDQSGCDTWFRTVAAELSKALQADIKVETQCSLPTGGDCCRRRIWVEESPG